MSAENGLQMYRMANGEVWIAVVSCGDVVPEVQDAVDTILAKCASYEEAVAAMRCFEDEDNDAYVYTEHGAMPIPSKERFEQRPECFLESIVRLRFGDRTCCCLDGRDVLESRWVVEEIDWSARLYGQEGTRVLHTDLSYAQALTFTHLYAAQQPGEIRVEVPTHFYHYSQYPACGCNEQRPESDLPPVH